MKNLPKIDEMMLRIEKRENLAGFPREIVKEACRTVVEELRARILRGKGETLCWPLYRLPAGFLLFAPRRRGPLGQTDQPPHAARGG